MLSHLERRPFGSHGALLLIVAMFAGCAPVRQVSPVPLQEPGDQTASCAELARQVAGNEGRIAAFLKQKDVVEGRNSTAQGVATASAVLVSPLGMLLAASMSDFSHEDQIMARSLIGRNERLRQLQEERQCGHA